MCDVSSALLGTAIPEPSHAVPTPAALHPFTQLCAVSAPHRSSAGAPAALCAAHTPLGTLRALQLRSPSSSLPTAPLVHMRTLAQLSVAQLRPRHALCCTHTLLGESRAPSAEHSPGDGHGHSTAGGCTAQRGTAGTRCPGSSCYHSGALPPSHQLHQSRLSRAPPSAPLLCCLCAAPHGCAKPTHT